jgi:hypothetical protein
MQQTCGESPPPLWRKMRAEGRMCEHPTPHPGFPPKEEGERRIPDGTVNV